MPAGAGADAIMRALSKRLGPLGLAGLLAATLVGWAAGIGGYTFLYAEGDSYLGNDPAACANCHLMGEQYAAWSRASHHAVAVCNDCHTPEHVVPKYAAKGLNGFLHSLAFSTGNFHEPIAIRPRNLEITERRCRGCHEAIVDAIDVDHRSQDALSCVRCHRDVGHLH